MRLKSPAFDHNQQIPSDYTCDGRNISPPLTIEDIPSSTQSLVLIVDDPDAPNGDFVHWLVWNIDPKKEQIKSNSIPSGLDGQPAVEGTTSFGKTGWSGPCPPSGNHHYQFKVFALDKTLDLKPAAQKKDLEKEMQRHIVDQALMVGLYQKK